MTSDDSSEGVLNKWKQSFWSFICAQAARLSMYLLLSAVT